MKITILRTLAGTADCPAEGTCAAILDLDVHPDRRYAVLKRETDQSILEACAHLIGADEVLGYASRDFLQA